MYIDVESAPERKLFLTILGSNPDFKIFRIRVSQVNRYKPSLRSDQFLLTIFQKLFEDLAPQYCLQYFTLPTGILKSFNYDDIATVIQTRQASYLVSLTFGKKKIDFKIFDS